MMERVSQGVADEYAALAASVRQDLWLAGLPVVDADGHSGANVYVDPFRIGDSEGVFVEWRISSELMDVFKGCVTRGELDHPDIPFGGAVPTRYEPPQGVRGTCPFPRGTWCRSGRSTGQRQGEHPLYGVEVVLEPDGSLRDAYPYNISFGGN